LRLGCYQYQWKGFFGDKPRNELSPAAWSPEKARRSSAAVSEHFKEEPTEEQARLMRRNIKSKRSAYCE
jgi:hypothetical protein